MCPAPLLARSPPYLVVVQLDIAHPPHVRSSTAVRGTWSLVMFWLVAMWLLVVDLVLGFVLGALVHHLPPPLDWCMFPHMAFPLRPR